MAFVGNLSESLPAQVGDLVDPRSKLAEFFKVLKDCPEPCGEIQCPNCSGEVETVFGSLPLQVICKNCRTVSLLRNLL